jgi:tetratricopeptide (TPR) repeat protein
VVLLVDKTFDPVVAADPEAFAFGAMMGRQLATAFADVNATPNQLERVNALAEALIVRDRPDEALLVLDDALARVRDRTRRPAFTDLDDSLNWAHDQRSQVLRMLGRDEEALEALAEGARQTENGRVNVSQTFNYAAMLLGEGRPAEALELLRDFDLRLASPYGRNVVRRIRVCAYARLGNEAGMQAALADIVAHGEDSLLQLRGAALCAGDYDLAASAFIGQFDLPTDRRYALLELQTFLGEGKPAAGAEETLYGRPDVQAMIERTVHRRSFPIWRP